jgi:hypothetical protein
VIGGKTKSEKFTAVMASYSAAENNSEMKEAFKGLEDTLKIIQEQQQKLVS